MAHYDGMREAHENDRAIKQAPMTDHSAAPAGDEENRLRAALIEAGRNVGACLDDGVSTDFLMYVPGEVKLKVARLRAELDEARAALARARDDALEDAAKIVEATHWGAQTAAPPWFARAIRVARTGGHHAEG